MRRKVASRKTRRSRLSRGRGRSFERQVLERLRSLGYTKAKRKLLSGAYLKTPYDITVSPFKLKLEAKRTLKDFIGMQKKWLDKVGPLLSLVFAIGSFVGKGSIAMYSAALISDKARKELDIESFTVVEVQSVKRIKADQLIFRFIVRCAGIDYLVEPFEKYLEREFPLNAN